jgi:hypothetical protein
MGTLYALTVSARQGYLELADATIAAGAKVLREQAHRDAKALINFGVDVVSARLKLFDPATKAKDIAYATVDKFLAVGKEAEARDIDGTGAREVLTGYLGQCDALRSSYWDGLATLRNWLDEQNNGLTQDDVAILAPLDPVTDVSAPQFTYDAFFTPGAR